MPCWRGRLGGRSGATLVELLVSAVVLAVALWAVASAFPFSSVACAGAQHRTAARAAAEARLGLCRALPFEALPAGSYRFEVPTLPEGSDARLDVSLLPGTSGQVKVVSVTISWPGLASAPASGGRVNYVTLVAQR